MSFEQGVEECYLKAPCIIVTRPECTNAQGHARARPDGGTTHVHRAAERSPDGKLELTSVPFHQMSSE